MKRKKVTLYLNSDHEPLCIEAYCSKCIYYKRHDSIEIQSHNSSAVEVVESERGDCLRYPDYFNRKITDWCGEFQPDVDSADV